MQQSTDTDVKRPIILYIIIAIALVAALVLGVWWAKNRANHYGQQQVTEQVSQPQGEPVPEVASQSPVQSPEQSAETASVPPAPMMTQPEPSTPVIVPATGPEQVTLPITSVSVFVFAALSYIRARRRLVNQAIRFTL